MNVQMMEGLVGASTSLKMSGTPMGVYRQASAEGDTEKMKQALGYTGECAENAVRYQEKIDKGMRSEAKAAREKAKLEREAAIEKRGEARKRAEEGAVPDRPRGSDLVQISEAARAALEREPAETAEPVDGEPVTYTPAGGITAVPAGAEPTVSLTV